MLKIAIVTGVWKRPEVYEMFVEGVKMLKNHFKDRVEIATFVSGSEGEMSRDMVNKDDDFYYVEVPNEPLGEKMNAACLLSKQWEPDYCLFMGSDDIIGINLFEEYLKVIEQASKNDAFVDYIYITDCYFYDRVSKKGLYWGGYIEKNNIGHAAGIGRVLSKRLLDKIKWGPWPAGYDHILDTGMDKKIFSHPITSYGIKMGDRGLFALDIKSEENMTGFKKWGNSIFVDGKEMLYSNLPKQLADMIA